MIARGERFPGKPLEHGDPAKAMPMIDIGICLLWRAGTDVDHETAHRPKRDRSG
jgi:hypothetical protein